MTTLIIRYHILKSVIKPQTPTIRYVPILYLSNPTVIILKCYLIQWNESVLFVIIGCSSMAGAGTQNRTLSASSEANANYAASQGRLNYVAPRGKSSAWCSRHNNKNQWIQVKHKLSYSFSYAQYSVYKDDHA